MKELYILVDGIHMGTLISRPNAKVEFTYSNSWYNYKHHYPLSISIPMNSRNHSSDKILPFLWNLLPDNEVTLEGWARQYQTSARNPFALLSHVGEDCAGSIQIVPPQRVEEVLSPDYSQLIHISEPDIAQRLRDLRKDASLGRHLSDTGNFSLAGAQAKTAFHKSIDGQWSIPSGRIPTTHIFKPSTMSFDGYEVNEYFCLELAGYLGLPRARSEVMQFEDQRVFVVERYDRILHSNRQYIRIHQEDCCQALGYMPGEKYPNEGGPNATQISELILAHSSSPEEDFYTFVRALILNWIILGTDAHAKNYAFLLGAGQTRLAPLYDISSSLPYPRDIPIRKAKLAMKIGDKYKFHEATAMGIDQDTLFEEIQYMLLDIIPASNIVLEQCIAKNLNEPVVTRLHETILKQSKSLQRWFSTK